MFHGTSIGYTEGGSEASSENVALLVQGKEKKEGNKAYIIKHFRCAPSQYEYVVSLTENEHQRLALAHLFASVFVQTEEEWDVTSRPNFVPVPAKLWERHLGGPSTWKRLRENSIIPVITPYDQKDRRCREFMLSPLIIDEYIRIGIEDESRTTLNLMTGRPVTGGLKTRLHDQKRNPVFPRSEPNQQALTLLAKERCPINLRAMLDVVHRFDYLARAKPTKRNRRRFIIAAYAYLTIRRSATLKRKPRFGPGIWSYVPAYRVLSTGRIVE